MIGSILKYFYNFAEKQVVCLKWAIIVLEKLNLTNIDPMDV